MNDAELAILKRHAQQQGDKELLWLITQAEKTNRYEKALKRIAEQGSGYAPVIAYHALREEKQPK